MARAPIIIRDESMRHRVLDLVHALDLSKPWQVTIEPYKKRRTSSQNALMWKWINEVTIHVRQHTGMDNDEIHEFFKAKLLPARIVEINGEAHEYRSTKKLTTAEMAAYMDAIYHWCTSELGLLLPLPEQMHEAA